MDKLNTYEYTIPFGISNKVKAKVEIMIEDNDWEDKLFDDVPTLPANLEEQIVNALLGRDCPIRLNRKCIDMLAKHITKEVAYV